MMIWEFQTSKPDGDMIRKRNIPRWERKVIGVQSQERPEMKFPNENYGILFPEEMEEQDAVMEYAAELKARERPRAYFDQVFFEFVMLSRRIPEGKLSANIARRINQVLRPMKKLLEAAGMTEMLDLLPEGSRRTGKEEFAEGKGLGPLGRETVLSPSLGLLGQARKQS